MRYCDLTFYAGKRVFVTGHTGFKGAWLCRMLVKAGAKVTGYALSAPTEPNLFALSGVEGEMNAVTGDVRDRERLAGIFAQAKPEIVLHLAAQPIVRDSYRDPVGTYETNVMGTVNLMECIRQTDCVRSFLNVTTDKVYENKEWVWAYRENEPLDGRDPYSNSKSCSELVTHSYRNSFFAKGSPAISTARAGNVIGGGDFAHDRIIPDCIRAVLSGQPVTVRNPHSIRPYQHVLEPLFAYLMIAARQYGDSGYAGWYNVGPDEEDCVTTGELTKLFCARWGDGAQWVQQTEENAPHEASVLKLDCAKLKTVFSWRPRWSIAQAVDKTVQWTKVWQAGEDVPAEMDRQIEAYGRDGL